MIHLGDITAISGYSVPPVDAVIGGSLCQDYPEEKDIPKIQRKPLYCKDLFAKTSG